MVVGWDVGEERPESADGEGAPGVPPTPGSHNGTHTTSATANAYSATQSAAASCALQQRSLMRKSSPRKLAPAVIPTGSYSLGTPPTSSTCKRRAAPEEPRCTQSQHSEMIASVAGMVIGGGQGRAGFRCITQVNASIKVSQSPLPDSHKPHDQVLTIGQIVSQLQ